MATRTTKKEKEEPVSKKAKEMAKKVKFDDNGVVIKNEINIETQKEEIPASSFTPEQIQEGLNALKDALIITSKETNTNSQPTLKDLENETGWAGSRGAVKIDKENIPKGQRPGMMIGLPTRAYHIRVGQQEKEISSDNLGRGAQKINDSRPVKN